MPAPAVNHLRFVAVRQDDALAEPLLAELAVEYATRYGTTEERVGAWLRGYPADEFAPPRGGMLIGVLDGRPVTGGAFRRFEVARSRDRRTQAHLDGRWAPQEGVRAGAARRAGERDRRGRIPSRLPDHRRPSARGRGAVPGHRISQAARTAAGRGRGLPGGVRQGSAMTEPLHVAVALEGYGWHPEAWRHTPERRSVLSGRYWVELARTAERGLLDFVTFDDGLTPQRRRRPEIEPDGWPGGPTRCSSRRGWPPRRSHIGLVPVATVTHTEPSHVAKAIATLDFVSHGRAGWQPRVSGTDHEAALFGRRDIAGADLFAEAVDAVDVVRGLWDSWDDDAVIRDVAPDATSTGIGCTTSTSSAYFSVKGPSITRARRRASPSSRRSRTPGRSTNSPPAVRIWSSSPPPTTTRCAPSSAELADVGGTDVKVFAESVRFLIGVVGHAVGRTRRTGRRRRAGGPAAALAEHRDGRCSAAPRGQRRRPAVHRRRGGAAAARRRAASERPTARARPCALGSASRSPRTDTRRRTGHDVPLSILDLAPISAGSDAATALHNTVDLAQHAEQWGYRRYWIAEHHFVAVASSSPAVLIGQIAAATHHIRVGAAAVQLGHTTARRRRRRASACSTRSTPAASTSGSAGRGSAGARRSSGRRATGRSRRGNGARSTASWCRRRST